MFGGLAEGVWIGNESEQSATFIRHLQCPVCHPGLTLPSVQGHRGKLWMSALLFVFVN